MCYSVTVQCYYYSFTVHCKVLHLKIFSGCKVIDKSETVTIDFSRYHLRVTYDATKQDLNENPQINFNYYISSNVSQKLGIRLPTDATKTIKWRYTEVLLEKSDQKLRARETWTLQIEDDGHTTLKSPASNVYENDFNKVPQFKGGNLKTSFDDFMTDGVSCYETFDPSPLDASMSESLERSQYFQQF